ncbi:AEC family transporter [Aliarcobacter butzleri]|uniref:Auxin efflux carrier protein n=2 Tax=Aliarcobacter butzleri TaxID=28197 RepID=A8EVK5_ALIB4|nr:AEC family transporter [Aliarcobacter butzleri]ABV67978.1 auxin efflux carrier protein [Aliarcobacter butzleri RM4018]MCG3704301.1 AEC family transporter [Aliarcobacter butzleri]MCG3706437.1 AEC family transporter [Aliarcobacter butzleri]MCT7586631.1 AEC family transporter [Aliarcobacter butzleri]MCT7591106.1 AEC family transporter [Aliarcobacter butzleri]
MIELLFNKLMPIVILIIIGYYWKKKELPFDKDMISSLIMNLGTPALLIASINNKDLTSENIITILIYGTIIIAICTILTIAYLKFENKPIRPFLQSFIFPNTGGLGIPIVYVLLGQTAFVYAITFSVLINIYHFTIGLWLSNSSLNLKKALQTPVLYALVLALAFKGTNTQVPFIIEDVCKMLGGIVIPLLLIAFGSSLVGIKIGQNIKAVRMGVVRVILGFLVVYTIFYFGNFEPVLIYTLLIQYSMPIATTSYLFALRFNGPSDEIAVMTASSTIAILFLLPVIIYVIG